MRTVESERGVLSWHDAIDIQNDVYEFWDATGEGVRVITRGPDLDHVELSTEAFPLKDAFRSYSESLGLQGMNVDGAPAEVWQRIQVAKKSLPKKRGWFSRLFSR